MRKLTLIPLVVFLVYGIDLWRTRESLTLSRYRMLAVERGDITSVVQATGTLRAIVSVEVSSQLSGRVSDVYADFNDEVVAGQPLARLEAETYEARVSEARASLQIALTGVQTQAASVKRSQALVVSAGLARGAAEAELSALQGRAEESERQLQRKLTLARSGNVAEAELGAARVQRDVLWAELRAAGHQLGMKGEAITIAEAELAMTQASVSNAQALVEQKKALLDHAEADLRRTEIRAPIGGTILKRDVNPGETVAVNLEAKSIFRIAQDLRKMVVHGRVDEADVGALRPGNAVTFTVDAYPSRTFTGELVQIRKAAETIQNVVTYTCVVSADNPDLALLPGMTATIHVVTRRSANVLKVPNEAFRFQPAESGMKTQRTDQASPGEARLETVWIPQGDRVTPVHVVAGQRDEQVSAVLSGALTEGQRVAVGYEVSTSDHLRSRLGR